MLSKSSSRFSGKVAPQPGYFKEFEDSDFNPNKKSVIYVFITFRSMDGVAMIEEAYNYSRCDRFWIFACQCFCTNKYSRMKRRYIGGNWTSPEPAILPDNILW